MSYIKLNLKARTDDGAKLFQERLQPWKRLNKGEVIEMAKRPGIKAARQLVKMFKGLCPAVRRISFSTVEITY